MKILFALVLIVMPFFSFPQDSTKLTKSKVMRVLSNKETDFMLTNYNRVPDSSSEEPKRVIVALDDKIIKLIENSGDALIPKLLEFFDDDQRDWASNLTLYALTRHDASSLARFFSDNNGILEWRKKRKQIDLAKWREYLAEIRQ